MLGDKSIIPEEKITRVYVQENLFSHILGQIDDSNNGISGIEKFFDQDLKTRKEPLKLTVDTNIQFLIREQLLKFQEIFKSQGSAAILMDVNNGEILSLVSLPDIMASNLAILTSRLAFSVARSVTSLANLTAIDESDSALLIDSLAILIRFVASASALSTFSLDSKISKLLSAVLRSLDSLLRLN